MVDSPIQCLNSIPSRVKVDKDYITILEWQGDKGGKIKKINPFDMNFDISKPLFLEFINIDTDNLESIELFVKKHGLLGLYLDKSLRQEKDLSDLISEVTENQLNRIKEKGIFNNNRHNYVPVITSLSRDLTTKFPSILKIVHNDVIARATGMEIEKTTAFIHEVKVMRCLSNLYKSNNFPDIRKHIKELKRLFIDKKKDFEEIESFISENNIEDFLNLKIVGYFITEMTRNTDLSCEIIDSPNDVPQVKVRYIVPTLLTGLYTMFYFHITNNGVINQCPVCKRFYDNNNSGCTDDCIRAIASRKYYHGKLKKNPIMFEYERMRKRMSARRNSEGEKRITDKEFEQWKRLATAIRNESATLDEFKKRINNIKL